jgi:hypothetical protein
MPHTYETDTWKFIPAKHHGLVRTVEPRLIVIHTPIWKEVDTGAEALGEYFAAMADGRVASAHIGVDNNSVVQYVKDSVVAYASPGANHDGLHVEIIGTHTQSKAQWRDPFSISALALAADAVAQWCIKYTIPTLHLTNDQLVKSFRGIVGHDQVSQVYKKSTHTDPGPDFPWGRFMLYVKGAYLDRTA